MTQRSSSTPLFEIRFYGDLEGSPHSYSSLEAALDDLAREWGWKRDEWRRLDKFGNQIGREPYTPDPEDDRVVIWKHEPGEESKAVWHFSGWHWSFDADDLPGGPLDQGKLPGWDKSLYELAMAE